MQIFGTWKCSNGLLEPICCWALVFWVRRKWNTFPRSTPSSSSPHSKKCVRKWFASTSSVLFPKAWRSYLFQEWWKEAFFSNNTLVTNLCEVECLAAKWELPTFHSFDSNFDHKQSCFSFLFFFILSMYESMLAMCSNKFFGKTWEIFTPEGKMRVWCRAVGGHDLP